MLLSTVLNLFFIPALYVILSTLMRKTRHPVTADKPIHTSAS
jgi:hypothetical protein